jgi:adenylate cyclase
MKIEKWVAELSLKNRTLYYRLNIIFGLFFIFPIFGFILFGWKYHLLTDRLVPLFFLGLMAFSFAGFTLLRRLFDQISQISDHLSAKITRNFPAAQFQQDADELHAIMRSFNAIEAQLRKASGQLDKRSADISILRELSELCHATFDPEEILYVTLERSLLLARADVGSILILDRPERQNFTVKASIGLEEFIKLEDKIDFETSVAKYAVINKAPLIVEDIEKDRRFGRLNRAHYGTKSFVCMPIKTSKDIVGVLTISRRAKDGQFTAEDVEALTPLLSNAAFTYENLWLLAKNERQGRLLDSVNSALKVINSSFRGSELLHAVLNEFHTVVAYDMAVVLLRDAKQPGFVRVFDCLAFGAAVTLIKNTPYAAEGSMVDRVIKHENIWRMEAADPVSSPVDVELFGAKGKGACLLTPLRLSGAVGGVLALWAEEPQVFEDAAPILDPMAKSVALAIEKTTLSEAVTRRDRELESIRQLGSSLASSTFDINQVLRYTMDMIAVIMDAEAGSMFLVQSDDSLSFAAAFNADVEALKNIRLKLGQGIAGYVAARGEAIMVNNAQASQHFFPEIDRLTGFSTRSALCVPMISQGKVLGVLEVLNKKSGDFDANDEDLLQSVASSVSIAIENARLYRETVSMAEHERGIRNMFQKFVPKEIVDQIIHGSETGKTEIEEFRTLTLLNIDLRGFSRLTRKIGPQKTVSLLNGFFSIMGAIVFKHNGIVDKYLGDGFLAIFGAPLASTMAADNAVAAALEMKDAVQRLNQHFVKELVAKVDIGVSLHTGEVVVGNIGFDMKMDYTVIGDPVNAVFRLQELTKAYPNGILISESTRRASRSQLEVRAIEVPDDIDPILKDLQLFELLGQKEAS